MKINVPGTATGLVSMLRWVLAFGGAFWTAHRSDAGEAEQATVGLPFLRSYSLNEIGASRGAKLAFDHLGRIAVVGGQTYSVLNDNLWIERTGGALTVPELIRVEWVGGCYHYGSLADWGRIEWSPEGSFRAVSRRPGHYPQWVRATNFEQILPVPSGVLYAGYNGIVHEGDSGRQTFIEVPELIRVFAIGSRVFISTHSPGILELDLETFSTRVVEDEAVDEVALLASGRILASTLTEDLVLFDGERLIPWSNPLRTGPEAGIISSLCALPDGGVAIAVDGRGVVVLTATGELQMALTTDEYHRVFDLAAREPGVLWLTTETTVQKVLYNSELSIVDQRSGVIVAFPKVVNWSGGTSISSNGRLYDMQRADGELSYRFRMPEQPPAGVWAMDAHEEWMLAGNSTGLFSRSETGFEPVLTGMDTSQIVMTENGVCYAIGKDAIAALRWNGTEWEEFAPRIPGVGFPSVVHEAADSVWIELGLNLAARLWISDEQLHSRIFDDFPWDEAAWVNIGVIDSTVVLTGPGEERLFFDEEKGGFVDAPALQRILNEAAYPLKRVQKDASGVLWAAHESGILAKGPAPSDRWEAPRFGNFRDRYPVVQLVGKDQVWVSTQSALYFADHEPQKHARSPRHFHPKLVSVTDGQSGLTLYEAGQSADLPESLPHSRNHLVFAWFAGAYASLEPISYQFTIRNRTDEWTIFSADSMLTLPNLWEGDYTLETQLLEGDRPVGEAVVMHFQVAPPWYRTRLAYLLYIVVSLLAIATIRQLAVSRTRRHNTFLEQLVRKRTGELRATMKKLTEEARYSATLAERNRLAGEIHDSLQQGLSGLMLQLDATLRLTSLSPEVRSRLAVARRMVSYTRHEVQQAVWDLESPLLGNEDLSEALQTIADLISSGSPRVEVDVQDSDSEIDSATKHHLLRIAQEAITNAVRHSGASRIRVAMEPGPEGSVLEISDDGCGFNASDAALKNGPGHFGLRGLRSRVSKFNGQVKIESEPGQGTKVRVMVPCPARLQEMT